MKPVRSLFALALLANACCSNTKPVADAPESVPTTQASAEAPSSGAAGGDDSTPPISAPTTSGAAGGGTAAAPDTVKLPPGKSCKLPAPKISEDSCNIDEDCGVSAPCHAEACVAKSKAKPPTADTMCTMSLLCHTADANRCGCYQGRCALIPPPDKTQ